MIREVGLGIEEEKELKRRGKYLYSVLWSFLRTFSAWGECRHTSRDDEASLGCGVEGRFAQSLMFI